MNAILFAIFSIGLLLPRTYTQTSSFFKSASEERLESVVEEELPSRSFNNPATALSLGTTSYGNYSYPGETAYFTLRLDEEAVIKLRYNGPSAQLKVYYAEFFDSASAIQTVADVTDGLDAYFICQNVDYVFAFQSLSVPVAYFSLAPVKYSLGGSHQLADHEQHALHLEYVDTGSVGYRCSVEKIDISSTTYHTTSSYFPNSYSTSYIDKLDSTHYFFQNEPSLTYGTGRKVVADTTAREYSAIARTVVGRHYTNPNDSQDIQDRWVGIGTSTFVSDTTLISCAHLFYGTLTMGTGTNSTVVGSLGRWAKFYPGAANDGSGVVTPFGGYKATSAYVSLSYHLSGGDTRYDWSIIQTEPLSENLPQHGYMGLSSFSIYHPNTLQDAPGAVQRDDTQTYYFDLACSAGYPGITECPQEDRHKYEGLLWANRPQEGEVSINFDDTLGVWQEINSEEIFVSPGNSGGPLYTLTSTIYQGHLVHYSYLIGICSGFTYWEDNFISSQFARSNQELVRMTLKVGL